MTDYTVGDTIYLMFTTRAFATGIPTVLAGTPVVSAYENDSATQITAGITLGVSHDSVVGMNLLTIVATGANGFESGKDYNMVITTGTVDSVSVVGEVVGVFSLGRSAAAVDLANGTDGLGAIKTETAAILVDTGTTLDGAIATIDTNVDAILVDTGTTLDAAIAVIDTNVDAILVDTGTTLDAAIAVIDTNVDQIETAVITNAAGADIAADIIAVKAETASILTDTGTTLDTKLNDIQGATFATGTDSLEAIRDRGDAAWTTGAGGSDRLLMVDTTIATLASQTSFTLTAGSADDDAYNNCTIVIEDVSTATQKAVGIVSDYTGSTKTVTLKYDPGIFTMATTDKVYILAENALKSTDANRQLDVTTTGAAGIDWANVENPTTALDLSGTDIQLVDTCTTNTDMVAAAPTAATVADAVWDEATADHVAAGSFGLQQADILTDTGTTLDAAIAVIDTNVDAILVDTGTTLDAAIAVIDTNVDQIETAVITNAAGADIAADIIAVKAETASILTDTGTTLDTKLNDIQGATFSSATDSLEAIRDRGDAAWITGGGGADKLVLQDTTIATLASQTSFTLTAGSADDDAYNNCTIVIEDAATATQKAVGLISDYTGSTKTVTLKYDPGIFTMAATDKTYILAENALKATDANRQLDVTATGAAGIDWANVENPTTAVDLSGTDIQLVDTCTTNTDVGAVKTDTAAILVDTGTTLDTKLNDIQGATFSSVTDSLEAIRDRGDSAWTTGAGGSDRLLLVDTTIATLASQTSFTLNAGSSDDDAYNNCTIVIEDAATAAQKAIGIVSDYTGSTKTVTLKYDPAVFTMATTDKVYILADNALKSSKQNRQLDIEGTIDRLDDTRIKLIFIENL